MMLILQLVLLCYVSEYIVAILATSISGKVCELSKNSWRYWDRVWNYVAAAIGKSILQ